jgi:hypothetical protein
MRSSACATSALNVDGPVVNVIFFPFVVAVSVRRLVTVLLSDSDIDVTVTSPRAAVPIVMPVAVNMSNSELDTASPTGDGVAPSPIALAEVVSLITMAADPVLITALAANATSSVVMRSIVLVVESCTLVSKVRVPVPASKSTGSARVVRVDERTMPSDACTRIPLLNNEAPVVNITLLPADRVAFNVMVPTVSTLFSAVPYTYTCPEYVLPRVRPALEVTRFTSASEIHKFATLG